MFLLDTISLSTEQLEATYTLDILKRSILGSIPRENKIKAIYHKEFMQRHLEGSLYRVKLLERTHTNQDEISIIEHDLALLRGNLKLKADASGEIIKILNLPEIKADWDRHKYKFNKIHKKFEFIEDLMNETEELLQNEDDFLSVIQESEMAAMLFPPIYDPDLTLGKTVKHHKVFNDFFGAEALPLEITTSIKKMDAANDKLEILREGVLDEAAFKPYEVRRYFRKLTDRYKLQTEVSAKYIETYGLNKNHWIHHAGQVMHVTVKGLFEYQQIIRVTPNPTS